MGQPGSDGNKMGQQRPGAPSFGKSKDLDESVQGLDLGPIKFKLAQEESPVDWSADQIDWAEEEYRKFLTMAVRNPGAKIVPSAPVDMFWHFHILDTAKYAEDCDKVFDHFLHHFPYLGLRGQADKDELNIQWEATLEIYKSMFGDLPKDTWAEKADCGRTDCCPGPPSCTNK